MQEFIISAGKKASDNHAAVWVPDSEASTCMHCMRVKFTAINRRVSKDDYEILVIFIMLIVKVEKMGFKALFYQI